MAAVCVFCASSNLVEARYLDLAREVGFRLAQAGHSLVSGGGRVGMMGTVAAGARAGGGHTVGVIPEPLVRLEVSDTESDELITTADMAERKVVMLAKADSFLILPGGLGTLDEFFEVWTLRTLHLHAKTVVILDPDSFYTGLLEWLAGLVPKNFVRSEALAALTVVRTVDAAIAAVS